jgi:hypothetical protein
MPYREKSLANLAARRAYEFCLTDTFGLERQLADFYLASKGWKREISNILRRQHGLHEYDACVFDYAYFDPGLKKKVHQSVFFLRSQRLVLPTLRMQPEHLLHKLGELFGFRDIDFVRYPKFSKQYRLTGEDEDFIRHHFSEEVLHYFTLNKGWSLEGIGYYFILYKRGLLLHPEETEALYGRGMEVYHLLSSGD